MKRPQGVDTATARRAMQGGARTRQAVPAKDGGESRPSAGDPPRSAARRAEPEAVTAPNPVSTASTRQPQSGPTPKSRRRPDTATDPAAQPTSPRATVVDEPAAPSPVVTPKSAARRRKRYERAEIKRFTRASRRRRMAWMIGIGSVVIVLLGAVLVSISPLMALRTIDVVGAQRVDAAAVRQALGGQVGTPLPLLDYSKIHDELGKFALIRSYSTEADPPGTLVVRIVERTPLALLKASDGFQLVDQAGVVMQTTPGRPGGYPLISFPDGASKSTRQSEFAASAAVLAALPDGMLATVATASATGEEDVTLKLSSGVTVVWGGPDDAELKSTVLGDLVKGAPHASLYDVSAPNSPVTR